MNSVITTFEVSYEYEDERLDKFLAAVFPDRSRTYFSKLIRDGNVTMSGKALKANYRLRAEDLITVELPPAERLTIEAENIPLDILREYESWGLCDAVKKVMGAWQR